MHKVFNLILITSHGKQYFFKKKRAKYKPLLVLAIIETVTNTFFRTRSY